MNEKKPPAVSRESFIRRHRTFFVGIFVLVPIVLIPGLLFYTLMKSEVFKQWSRFHVVYDQGYGLTKGNAVTVSGMNIGYVERVALVREGIVVVRFKIDREYHHFVRSDTRALLKQKNLVVGDWEIQLTGGSDTAGYAAEGDTLESVYSLRIDKLTEQVMGMVNKVQGIIDTIAAGKGNVGRVLMGDSLVDGVQTILANVNRITLQSAVMLRRADTLLVSVSQAGASGAAIADSVRGLMTNVRTMMISVQGIVDSSAIIVNNVKSVSGELGPFMVQVQDNLDQVESMMRGLQNNWLVRRAIGENDDPMLK
ncbi:MAG: MlaD family protein [Chitinispirillaceae bacterium]|jgi:phospholipid/cholesterol/gamma-HCH transport system substrate-binding protein|nr:MlaD family protein [Chitinispirillaceae bacterium]